MGEGLKKPPQYEAGQKLDGPYGDVPKLVELYGDGPKLAGPYETGPKGTLCMTGAPL